MAANAAVERSFLGRHALVRALLFLAGSLFVALGIIGLFLPLVPTTIFLILASFCYANSSERAHRWLTTNRWFGRLLRDYQEGRGMPVRAKVIAIGMLWAGMAISAWIVGILWVEILLAVVAAAVTVYLLRLRTAPA